MYYIIYFFYFCIVFYLLQSQLMILSAYYYSRSLLLISTGYGHHLSIIIDQTYITNSTHSFYHPHSFFLISKCQTLLDLLKSVDLIDLITFHHSKITVPTSRYRSSRSLLFSSFRDWWRLLMAYKSVLCLSRILTKLQIRLKLMIGIVVIWRQRLSLPLTLKDEPLSSVVHTTSAIRMFIQHFNDL